MKHLYYLFFSIISFTGCIEPYSFDIKDPEQTLVIESYISNVSYNESLQYPSNGYYFTTKLRYGSVLSNKGGTVQGARVTLIADNGDSWLYTESYNEAGVYRLMYEHFKAVEGVKYKLHVLLPTDEQIESQWESLPANQTEMGEITFEETEKYAISYLSGGNEQQITKKKGINLQVGIPSNPTPEKRYFKWTFEPTWIYLAGRLPSSHPNYRCWVDGRSYLSQYAVAEDINGGYDQDVVFIAIDDNERVYEAMSILTKQFGITKDYYNFLVELEDQSKSSGIFDAPPYNLKTNYSSSASEFPIFGYFSVVHEQAKRWYFSVNDLSYYVDNRAIIEMCRSAIPPYPSDDPCGNCIYYDAGGKASLDKPYWWQY